MKTVLLALILCASASAQIAGPPFAFWKSGAVAFNPRDFSGLRALYMADSLGVAKSSGDTIFVWRDRSGNASHALQTTGAAKPIWYADSVSGKPSMYFDGARNFLHPITDTSAVSVFLVIKRNGDMTGYKGLIAYSTTPGWMLLSSTASASNTLSLFGSADRNSTYAIPRYTPVVVGITQNFVNGGGTFWQNGAAAGTYSENSRQTDAHIGGRPSASQGFIGHISEVIIYSRLLNSTEAASVMQYLKSKWGTP